MVHNQINPGTLKLNLNLVFFFTTRLVIPRYADVLPNAPRMMTTEIICSVSQLI